LAIPVVNRGADSFRGSWGNDNICAESSSARRSRIMD
jgi:hypothetical protein